jgi:3-hydroxy-9,10-secoandrosta-1,3,5(10)-triene-9,17-dione monooxygenase
MTQALSIPDALSRAVDVSDIAGLDSDALRAELVRRANELVPLLERNATKTEADRRVVEANIDAIRAAGLFRIMVPRRFGGLETDMRTCLDVSRELAKGCGSTAWVTTLLNLCSWLTAHAGAEAQDEIWGHDGDARVAGVFTPSATARRVEGGFVVTGKWAWASGCFHADWAFVGIPITDEQGAVVDQGFILAPMRELTIEETWFVTGMKGTGSNTIVAEDVFVPDHRILRVGDCLAGNPPTPYKDEALYRAAFVPVTVLGLMGPMLGLCTQAFDFVLEKASKRAISYTVYTKQTQSPSFQLALAHAASTVDAAHLFAYRAADEIDRAARQGRHMTYLERTRIRMDVGKALTYARDAIDQLISAHGAGSFAEVSPLQRIWRDCETASRHAVLSPAIGAELYGRALVGIEEGVTPLV